MFNADGNANFNLVLAAYAIDAFGRPGSAIDCATDGVQGAMLTLDLSEGQGVILVVDGAQAPGMDDAGQFELSVTQL